MRLTKTSIALLLLAPLGLLGACATVVPMELANARTAYHRASVGTAAQLAPAEVHKAKAALAEAEQSFVNDPKSQQTKDLAYVAERKAQLAEARGSFAAEEQRKSAAQGDLQNTRSQMAQKTKADLSDSRRDLAASERGREGEAAARATAEAGRAAAEASAAAADERARLSAKALADLAAVKQEPRGMVITLSGSVLFATDKYSLLPAAQERLNQVATALLTTQERRLVVEGHTDSQGSERYNLTLSQNRADAVRAYLVSRGYNANRIEAHGIGKARPVSENGTAEGRANNRRVEIIVAPQMHSSR
jgi:outer membrane protein OmpA-like peptidoglycan-associated protein